MSNFSVPQSGGLIHPDLLMPLNLLCQLFLEDSMTLADGAGRRRSTGGSTYDTCKQNVANITPWLRIRQPDKLLHRAVPLCNLGQSAIT